MESSVEPTLSVVIPCYQEVQRLEGAVSGYRACIERLGVTSELIVVDDGSTDGTREAANALFEGEEHMRCLGQEHRGKGAALKAGILAARGRWIIIADADWSMSADQAPRLFEPYSEETESAVLRIASREHPDSVRIDEPLYRHLLGRVFNHLVRLFLVGGHMDTQCGFKGFSAPVGRELCREVHEDGWAFDVEFLLLADRHGYTVESVPIRWVHDRDSRVRACGDSWSMGWALVRIGLRHGTRWRPRRRSGLPSVAVTGTRDSQVESKAQS